MRGEVRVALESFRPIWEEIKEAIIERHTLTSLKPGKSGIINLYFDLPAACHSLGITTSEWGSHNRCMQDWRNRETVNFELCDRILTNFGRAFDVHRLYLVTL